MADTVKETRESSVPVASESCCYVMDPCGCVVDACGCGCYVDPCCC
jgi:hypothetical protein